MTIDEAIKIQETILKTLPVTLAESEKQAIKLGIEALKREVNYRMAHPDVASYLLPGETRG